MDITNILISGVGGQGLVVAIKIIAETAFKEGYDVKTSDVIGLSQRGGIVWGCARFGKIVHSALVPKGQGDILVAMEKLEGIRWIGNIKKDAKIILNSEIIYPNKVLIEKEEYPEDIEERLNNQGFGVIPVDAKVLARKVGNIKVANIVLLGSLSKLLPFREESWIRVIEQNVPKSTIAVNIAAFKEGRC